MNNMSVMQYAKYIENKYIDIIKKNINKTDMNIILCYSMNNVIKYLQDNNYLYIIRNKILLREEEAIIDMLCTKRCNNIFIGNFNMKYLNGSTFSFLIIQHLKNNVQKILIDLDRITEPEYYYI